MNVHKTNAPTDGVVKYISPIEKDYIPYAKLVTTHAVDAEAPGKPTKHYVVCWYRDITCDYDHQSGVWYEGKVTYKGTYVDGVCQELDWEDGDQKAIAGNGLIR